MTPARASSFSIVQAKGRTIGNWAGGGGGGQQFPKKNPAKENFQKKSSRNQSTIQKNLERRKNIPRDNSDWKEKSCTGIFAVLPTTSNAPPPPPPLRPGLEPAIFWSQDQWVSHLTNLTIQPKTYGRSWDNFSNRIIALRFYGLRSLETNKRCLLALLIGIEAAHNQPRSQCLSSSRPPGAREQGGKTREDTGNEVVWQQHIVFQGKRITFCSHLKHINLMLVTFRYKNTK